MRRGAGRQTPTQELCREEMGTPGGSFKEYGGNEQPSAQGSQVHVGLC